ncbi:MAG: cytidine deaminase [Calditrichaeota bacterium]|nr:cytidine deaminase [Calditrichota bacterium]
MKDEDLVAAAWRARDHARAPYSDFRVGAALLTADGQVISGANVESSSYGLSMCAERVALFSALSAGHTRLARLAIAAESTLEPYPCGACLQLLSDYAGGIVILLSRTPSSFVTKSLEELLPHPFGKSHFVHPHR